MRTRQFAQEERERANVRVGAAFAAAAAAVLLAGMLMSLRAVHTNESNQAPLQPSTRWNDFKDATATDDDDYDD